MSEQVTITFNGKNIQASPGANVLQVAKDNGIAIAHYCYHEGLSIAGVCRLCMVKVNDNPKPVPSCNLTVQAGMKIDSISPDIQEIVRWGLQFHLANHPLDCPICDQAGECILQDSYMQYGLYDSNMTENKVHKGKVVSLGSKIVLDKERCILCTRCTRFTSEVTKTHDLGIFNRGDRSEIGTVDDKPFENDYSLNTVDICPVGALTSKEFRFKQRVWYTKTAPSVCMKCSTGCNISVTYNKYGTFRVLPRKNPEVNGLWMCDKGRDAYRWLNTIARYMQAYTVTPEGKIPLKPEDIPTLLAQALNPIPMPKTAWIISPQHTVEEYQALYVYFHKKNIRDADIYLWYDWAKEITDFDGLLLRGDKSPNTQGLSAVSQKTGYTFDIARLHSSFVPKAYEQFVFLAPENLEPHTSLETLISSLPLHSAVWLGARRLPKQALEQHFKLIVPALMFGEKSGTFINHAGKSQRIEPFLSTSSHVHNLITIFQNEVV